MAGGADEYQQNKEGKCRHCYQKKPPLKKLLCHILNQHKDKLSDEIQEINGHFCAKIKLPLLEGSVEPGTIICKTRWNNGQNVDYVSAQKICTLPKFRTYIMNINKGQCPQINEENVIEALSQLSSTIEIDYSLIPGKVSNKQRLLQKSSGKKRIHNVSLERNPSQNIISPEPPSPRVSMLSGITSVSEERSDNTMNSQQTDKSAAETPVENRQMLLQNRVGINTPRPRIQHRVPVSFYDALKATNDGLSNVNDGDESRCIDLSVSSSSEDDDVDNGNVSIDDHPVLPAVDVPSTTNIADTIDIIGQLMGLNLGSRNDNNASPASNSVRAAETNRTKPDECRLASSNTSTESSTPTSISESSKVTTLEGNENPEDHFNAFPYEAIPAHITDYVNKNQSISQPKLQSQESPDVPPTEIPAPSSTQNSEVVQNPATSISSILDQISRLRKDCRRPMIIDAESLFDLQHVILGDYLKYKNIDPHLCLFYPTDPEKLAPTVKCQSLHMYILKGGSPLKWFFFSPKLDTTVVERFFQYISWWNREMSTFGFLFCSHFMTADNQKQEVPIGSFMSNVACFPFSSTFKEVIVLFYSFKK
uniref:C2H2-type domain-containing protein n=1 Tax=Panagrolaimus davidi TaxID=227884 RepID=A0A914PIX8_9BILA